MKKITTTVAPLLILAIFLSNLSIPLGCAAENYWVNKKSMR
jgi:N-acetylneuraminic acid mutarotase